MIIVKAPIWTENANNCHQQPDVNGQINQAENSIGAYRQNGGLSSTDEGSRQIKGTCVQQLHYNSPYDIEALLEGYPKIEEIPDYMYQKLILGAEKGGHLDNPGENGQNGDIVLARYKSIDLLPPEGDT